MRGGLISLMVFAPALGALLVAALPATASATMRRLSIAVSFVPLVLALVAWNRFDAASGEFQLVERMGWIASFGASYLVGIDGISLLLILLTVVLTPLVLLASADSVHHRLKGYLVSMLLLETTMLGTLVALDLLLFYVFWELMLVPMYLIIGVWGGERRVYASIKFILFTMVGSLPMLLAIIYLGLAHAGAAGHWSFALTDLYGLALDERARTLCFLAFFLAFAVKVPMWPLHTWLPDAHVEAPTGGSVILAGVLLKMGTYGFVRFVLPLFPQALPAAMPWVGALAVIGIIYGALVAMVQPDLKKLVAYSSVSHLGFVMLGVASLTTVGLQGAVYQMLNHGVSTGALFLLVGVIYERRHTRQIAEFGGLWARLPVYAVCFLVVMLSSIGLPGTNGFVGEFLILLGAFRFDRTLAALAVSGVVLGAAYMLWMYQRVMFGPAENPANDGLADMSWRELAVMAPLLALVFLMGVYPQPFLHTMEASVVRTLTLAGVAAGHAPAPAHASEKHAAASARHGTHDVAGVAAGNAPGPAHAGEKHAAASARHGTHDAAGVAAGHAPAPAHAGEKHAAASARHGTHDVAGDVRDAAGDTVRAQRPDAHREVGS